MSCGSEPCSELIPSPNKVTPANAGGALSFQGGRPWPGIAEFVRSPSEASRYGIRAR
jgi:hypothetical protein